MEKKRRTSRQKTCPQRVVVSASAESRHNGQVIASDGLEIWGGDVGGVATGEVVPRGGILLPSVRRSAGVGVGGTYAGDPVLDKADCGRTLAAGGDRGLVEGWATAEGRFDPGLLIRVMRGGDVIESKLCMDPLGEVGERLEAAYGVGESWWAAAVFDERLAGIGTGADAGAGTSSRRGTNDCLLWFSGPLCGSRATLRRAATGVGVEVVRPLRIG